MASRQGSASSYACSYHSTRTSASSALLLAARTRRSSSPHAASNTSFVHAAAIFTYDAPPWSLMTARSMSVASTRSAAAPENSNGTSLLATARWVVVALATSAMLVEVMLLHSDCWRLRI